MKADKFLIAITIVCVILVVFCANLTNSTVKRNKELKHQVELIKLELKLYKLNCKDEALQKQIQNDIDSVRNAINFFGGKSTDILP
ncbi:MAG: hypothetical protein OHK0045_21940 [Raineya sp.]